jgi:hypothetical protein
MESIKNEIFEAIRKPEMIFGGKSFTTCYSATCWNGQDDYSSDKTNDDGVTTSSELFLGRHTKVHYE